MAEYWTNGMATLYQADARELPLADKSVHCAVTSPPYWGLRDYGLGNWTGGNAECEHKLRTVQALPSAHWMVVRHKHVRSGQPGLTARAAIAGQCSRRRASD